MFWTRNDANCPLLDRDHRLACTVRRKAAAWATDTTSWPVIKEVSRIFGSKSTDGGKLLHVVITSNQGDSEPIQKQERYLVISLRVEGGLTSFTPNRWMVLKVVRLLRRFCRSHSMGYNSVLTRHTGKLCGYT